MPKRHILWEILLPYKIKEMCLHSELNPIPFRSLKYEGWYPLTTALSSAALEICDWL